MRHLLLWLWCFPQNLVGFIVKHITKATLVDDHYEFNIPFGSVSLGEYIFLCPGHRDDETVLLHEKGHRTQSRMLGWLYLPFIALPSIIWAGCFDWYRKKHNVSYYWFPTEKWADNLAGIDRTDNNPNN